MGRGFRESLDILAEVMPVERLRFPTGAKVFDWIVPREWNVRDAFLVDPQGRKFARFDQNNLHLVGYSVPFQGELSLAELKPHLHSIPERPDTIPYLTSYYREQWGFCLTHRELESLQEGRYKVTVDTELAPGELVLGEAVLPGESSKEILFSTYLCHPSMANNELSGPLAVAFLYRKIAALPRRRFTYRFLISSETMGTIAFLSHRGHELRENIIAGYQVTCVGDRGRFTYRRSRHGNTLADRAVERVFAARGEQPRQMPFDPSEGSDERQYCSPGFDFPLGSLMRTPYTQYAEYHTSDDNKAFISFEALQGTIDAYLDVVKDIEGCSIFRSLSPYGEPQLGKRGLYDTDSYQRVLLQDRIRATLWLLNLADGQHELQEIQRKSGLPLELLEDRAAALVKCALIERI